MDLLKGVAWETRSLGWMGWNSGGSAALMKVRRLPRRRKGEQQRGPVHYQAPSSVVEVSQDGGTEFFSRLPPEEFGREATGCFLMGGLFSLIALVLFSFVFFDQSGGGFGAVVMLGLFLAVGIGLAILGVHLGTRRAEIEVAVGTLRVSHGSVLFADKTHIWRRPEISSLRVEFSGLTVNNHRVNELRVYDGEGKKEIGCLAWLPEEDLQWIRSELTRALWGEGA